MEITLRASNISRRVQSSKAPSSGVQASKPDSHMGPNTLYDRHYRGLVSFLVLPTFYLSLHFPSLSRRQISLLLLYNFEEQGLADHRLRLIGSFSGPRCLLMR